MMRALRVAVFVVLASSWSVTPASAQFFDFMEWVDYLRGPQFQGVWGDIPLLCFYKPDEPSRVQLSARLVNLGTRDNQTPEESLRAIETERFLREKVEVRSFRRLASEVPIPPGPKTDDVSRQPGEQQQISELKIRFCGPLMPLDLENGAGDPLRLTFERRFHIGVRAGLFGSEKEAPFRDGDNPLEYAPAIDRSISVFSAGPVVAWTVHPKLDLAWAFEANRFSGDAFDTFWRPSFDPIGVNVRPLAPGLGRVEWVRRVTGSFQVTARVKQYLGQFTDADFGAVPGSYRSQNERVLMIGYINFDLTRLIWPDDGRPRVRP